MTQNPWPKTRTKQCPNIKLTRLACSLRDPRAHPVKHQVPHGVTAHQPLVQPVGDLGVDQARRHAVRGELVCLVVRGSLEVRVDLEIPSAGGFCVRVMSFSILFIFWRCEGFRHVCRCPCPCPCRCRCRQHFASGRCASGDWFGVVHERRALGARVRAGLLDALEVLCRNN